MDTTQDESGDPRQVALTEGLGLVERLRACAEEVMEFPHPSACDHLHDAAATMREAAAEIDRLRAALKAANDQAARFEREWYLRGDVLERLHSWANAYPVRVFPEPDFGRAQELLQAGGMSLDAISASNMRHVLDGVRELVAEGLKA